MAHIDLSVPCRTVRSKSPEQKCHTLTYFELEDDVENWQLAGINRNHVCACDSQRGWCRTPEHYYIGTASENHLDYPGRKGRNSGKSIYINPETGVAQMIEPHLAKSLGWRHINAGRKKRV